MTSKPLRATLVTCLAAGLMGGCALELEGGTGGGAESGGADGGSAGDAGPGASSGTGEGGSGNVAVGAPEAGQGGAGATDGSGGGDIAGAGGGGEPALCSGYTDVFATVASVVVDDSNSFASPLLVRELVFDPLRPSTAHLPVRPHEFLNYYATPLLGGRLDVHADDLHIGGDAQLRLGDPLAEGASLAEVLVTVTADDSLAEIAPDVTFVLDASVSMGGEGTDRLEGVVLGAVEALVTTQSVAVVTTNPSVGTVRPMAPWNADDVSPILEAARRLSQDADLGASLEDALALARDQAELTQRPGVVMVVSDGSLAIDDGALQSVTEARAAGVRVVGVGVGPARGYADDVFDALTDLSGGAYWYAPDRETATREVAARFQQLTRIAARDVSLRVHLPAGMTVAALSGGPGEQGPSVAAEGQNLGLGGTMPFHMVLAIEGPVVECAGIGVQVVSTDAAGVEHVSPEEPAVFRLDDALAPDAIHSVGLLRGSAVVAAAEALRGERTVARLERAAERIQRALKEGTDPDDPLVALCGQVLALCAERGADCVPCSPY